MRNLWVQTETERVSWWADLSSISHADDLISFVVHVATLARDCSIARFDVAEVEARLRSRYEHEGLVDLRLSRHAAPATLAWYDREGAVVEGEVLDPGALLKSVLTVPNSLWSRHAEHWSPLVVTGSVVRFTSRTGEPAGDRTAKLGFMTYTDLWFPFVLGVAHPSCDAERYFDNRELASRHTPRLNRFLSEVLDLVVAAGGRWEVDDDVVPRGLKPWVTERGIRLDGPVPPLMPPELVDVPWPALDDE
jgi:hypothetical protein